MCSFLEEIINFKCLNLKYVSHAVGHLHLGLKRLLPIVDLMVFLLADLHCYLTQYEVLVWFSFCAVDRITHYTYH